MNAQSGDSESQTKSAILREYFMKRGDKAQNLTTMQVGYVHGFSQWGRLFIKFNPESTTYSEKWEKWNIRKLNP